MGTRPRRRLDWAVAEVTRNATATGTTNVDDLLSAWRTSEGNSTDTTIMRIHVSGSYSPATVGGTMHFGLIVGRQVDPSQGQPHMDTEEFLDWMLYTKVWPTASGATVDAVQPFSFDLKSKRKVPTPQSTLLGCWMPTDTAASSITYIARILLALP